MFFLYFYHWQSFYACLSCRMSFPFLLAKTCFLDVAHYLVEEIVQMRGPKVLREVIPKLIFVDVE